jgi:fructose-1-phosphate kinase PfkB-like protein
VVNPAGAGDGMAASLAMGLAERWTAERVLREGMAIAGSIVENPRTGECNAERIAELRPQVRLRRL